MPRIGRALSIASAVRGPRGDQRRKLVETLDYSVGDDIPKRRTLVMRSPNPTHADLLRAPNIIDRAISDHDCLIGRDTQAT